MQSIKTNSPIEAVAAVPVLSMPTDTIPAPTEEEVASIDVVDDVTETIVEETPNPKVITETPKMPQELDRILNRGSVAVPDFEKGYYVVTNVFSNAENAANWSTTLRSMEYEPQTMQRPDTNLFYVFVAHGQDGVALYETLKNVRSKEFLKSAWMLKINMD